MWSSLLFSCYTSCRLWFMRYWNSLNTILFIIWKEWIDYGLMSTRDNNWINGLKIREFQHRIMLSSSWALSRSLLRASVFMLPSVIVSIQSQLVWVRSWWERYRLHSGGTSRIPPLWSSIVCPNWIARTEGLSLVEMNDSWFDSSVRFFSMSFFFLCKICDLKARYLNKIKLMDARK